MEKIDCDRTENLKAVDTDKKNRNWKKGDDTGYEVIETGSRCAIGCPLCTKSGFILFFIGVLLVSSNRAMFSTMGVIFIILAYIIPYNTSVLIRIIKGIVK